MQTLPCVWQGIETLETEPRRAEHLCQSMWEPHLTALCLCLPVHNTEPCYVLRSHPQHHAQLVRQLPAQRHPGPDQQLAVNALPPELPPALRQRR